MGAPAPGVSVVVPTIGRHSVLRAISSAMAQVEIPVQVIVVDDSPDGLKRDITLALRDVVRVEGPHRGPAAARNVGVQAATMPWLAFLDDDDEWDPRKLVTQLAPWSPSDDVVLSCRARVIIGGHVRERPRRVLAEDVDVLDALYRKPRLRSSVVYVPTPSFVVPTRWAKAVSFDETLAAREDIWWLHQLHQQGLRFVQTDQTLLTVNTNLNRGMARETLRSHLAWCDYLDNVDPALSVGYLSGMALRNAAYSGDADLVRAVRATVRDRGGRVRLPAFAAAMALAHSAGFARRVKGTV